LFSSCCCYRSATPWGLALFRHRSASRIFIMQPGRNLQPVVIHKDDYQHCGGEKRAELRPPPCPQLQGCSSSSLRRKASRVGVLPSAWAGDPLLPPAFRGEGRSPALRRRRTSATRGRPAAGAVSFHMSGSSAWMALVPPPALPPAAWSGRGCPSTARATVVPCTGQPHPRLLPRRRPHRGVVQDVVRHGGGDHVLGWYCPHSRIEDGSEDLFARAGAAAIRRYGTGAEVAAAVGAEVVAAAGEAPHCRGGCLRWRDRQCHRASDSLALMASLSPPVGRRGQGPFRSGVHAEVIATAGESSVQRWPPPSVLRWSPLLAIRSELVFPRPYRCGGSSYL
jgi:hypothetical protein